MRSSVPNRKGIEFDIVTQSRFCEECVRSAEQRDAKIAWIAVDYEGSSEEDALEHGVQVSKGYKGGTLELVMSMPCGEITYKNFPKKGSVLAVPFHPRHKDCPHALEIAVEGDHEARMSHWKYSQFWGE